MVGWMRRLVSFAWLAAVVLVWPAAARAEDYVLGSEDVVAVSVWLHPELERTLTINADGNVTLPPVGEIKAAGLTTKQLGEKMADRLSAYLRQTTTVTVTVSQYVSKSVYVTGGVAKPGRYGFERIPTLVEVLGQAGGAQAGVDLAAVQVVRTEGDQRHMIPADVAAAMRTGDSSKLPALKAGDTVIVPGVPVPGAPPAPGEGVAVLGEVAKPGLYAIAGTQDVWNLIAAAGGTTQRGNIGNVRLLTRGDEGLSVATLDLKEVLAHGSRTPAMVKNGDVLVVMPNPRGLPDMWNGLGSILAVSRDVMNLIIINDYLKNNNNKVAQ